eukprot:5485264-Karenia_brevis.AAC.1
MPGYQLLPDREIMWRILLRGEALVSLKRVCDSSRVKPNGTDPALTKPKAVRMTQVVDVAKAALSTYKVA